MEKLKARRVTGEARGHEVDYSVIQVLVPRCCCGPARQWTWREG